MSLINTGALDFADIKANLKTFLSAQTELVDYDFDGSVISTLIDLLAYNTHYNALYTNLAINETFIDSASKRSSITSIAKLLGYTPKSVTSAKATVNIAVTPADQSSNTITLAAGTTFSTEISGAAFVFNLMSDVSASKGPGATQFLFTNLSLSEGEKISITYTKLPETKFVVPERTADMSSLKVSAFNPATSTTTVYSGANTIVDTKSTDNVFFTKQRDNGLYEIFFGDGVFGTIVPVGAVVTLTYLISAGTAANGAAVFSYSGSGNSSNSYQVTTVFASSGGAAEEDKESIRFFAPLSYQAQGRAVTAHDYAALVGEAHSNIESIAVWGGQDNIPPQYGKVFIAVKPYGKDTFSTQEKLDFRKGIISKRGMVTVTPEFVDPRYFDVELDANIYYDPRKTTLPAGQIETAVRDVVATYSATLSKFDVAFRHSTITAAMTSADKAIVSSISSIRVRYGADLYIGADANYSYNFANPIHEEPHPTFYSTRFYLKDYTDRGYLRNNGTDIEFYTEDAGGVPHFQKVVGTINFNGSVSIPMLHISSLYDPKFEFVFWPSSYDVIPPNGIIVRLPAEYTRVSMVVDSLSQARNSRREYVFSSSR